MLHSRGHHWKLFSEHDSKQPATGMLYSISRAAILLDQYSYWCRWQQRRRSGHLQRLGHGHLIWPELLQHRGWGYLLNAE